MKKRIKIDNTLIMFIDSGDGPVSNESIDIATKFLYQMKIENLIADTDRFLTGKELPIKLYRELGVAK